MGNPILSEQFTPEQKLRFKEIEFETWRKQNHCCQVAFEGKERELRLREQLNRERACCCTKVAQANECCCKQGFGNF